MSFTLTPHTFFAEVSASTASSWYPVDWRSSGQQNRTIMGTKTSAQTVHLEVKTSVGGANPASVITTATSWAGGETIFGAVLVSPVTDVRVILTDVSGSGDATVVGML